jgi:GTPase SAR1 family protein
VPGNERFRRPAGLTEVYYRHSHGAMVITDLGRRQTFLAARAWIADYRAATGQEELGPPPILLLGNKSDLQNVTVNREEYNSFVEEYNLLGFFEVSARDNTNVGVAVRSLVDGALAWQAGL